ncbi:MAG: hypothetical protein AB2462_08055 [Thermoanaerobacter sp.]|uniref:hypothetical protein n=1 Tax=unclassified Thermoanaerobacter TaxID=2636821 RepID=UPI0001A976B4|nr:hypothetical protein [Thermoanaerobacter sp. X514]
MHTNYITKFLKAEDIIFEDIIETTIIYFSLKIKGRHSEKYPPQLLTKNQQF